MFNMAVPENGTACEPPKVLGIASLVLCMYLKMAYRLETEVRKRFVARFAVVQLSILALVAYLQTTKSRAPSRLLFA